MPGIRLTRRIAMWSGPRNISTAMMRSWGNRPDCAVIDEPLYAFYLAQTGIQHPGRESVLEHQAHDWEAVAETLCGPVPGGAPVWYQKHMAHHLLPDVGREWLLELENCFLIRSPAAVLSSYIRSRPQVRLDDLGFVQQAQLFHWLEARTGKTPVVVESKDILCNPEPMLRALCHALELPFHAEMLSWAAGPRNSDGVWAKHWYGQVHQSTGFLPYQAPLLNYPDTHEPIIQAAQPHYQALYERRLIP